MNQILVSIITPTYNHENFIGKCIESVLAQTYPHWEQIIIDDGSNDKTGQIVTSYNDNRIKYIKQENRGIWKLNDTYNAALENSNGELIAVLEGDDFWPPDKLEKQISVFNDPKIVLSWGKAVATDINSEFIGYRPKSIEWLKKNSNKKIFKYLFFGNFIPACTVICRKDTLIDIHGFKQPHNVPYVDHLTWLELGLKGKFQYIDDVLGYWRNHEKQISSTKSAEMVKLGYSIDLFKKLPKNKIDISLFDLMIYNIILLKFNIVYDKSSINRKEQIKSLDKKISLYQLNVLIRTIYISLKINIAWIILIIKNAF